MSDRVVTGTIDKDGVVTFDDVVGKSVDVVDDVVPSETVLANCFIIPETT